MPRQPVPQVPPFRTAEERAARPSLREIACRRCGKWMTHAPDFRWYHTGDGTPACLDPDSLLPYPDEAPASDDTATPRS